MILNSGTKHVTRVTGHVTSVAHTRLYELLNIRQLPIRTLVLAMVGLELKQRNFTVCCAIYININKLVTRQRSSVACG